jgi:copper resistance protein B
MTHLRLLALTPLAISTPALAQQMDHAAMPGMAMPAAKVLPAKAAEAIPKPAVPAAAETAAMPDAAPVAIPSTPPPPPMDYAADRYFDPVAMAGARTVLRREHGGGDLSKVTVSLAEHQARTRGEDGYRWEGQAWFGGDIDRFVLKTEGEGTRRDGLEAAEGQALYSHAIGPYFDLQAGVRQDFNPRARTYATVGVEGLAPYWFDVEGALFLSTQGEFLARAEATYDLRLTQRWILQPRVELNFAAQDTRETRTGSGLSNAEFGLRLRYEITREFAPYVGISHDRKFGATADYARTAGEATDATSLVVGVRAWF